ncbi:MAG: hypothetical protein QNJ47_02610 [Nostocaceae cyanobacterium]|nr:hypothetical protein [Nostocaceae cyanobacterium]
MPENQNVLDNNEIVYLGTSLQKIEQKILKKSDSQGGTRIWFQGGEPYFDVVFELLNDEIVWFEFTLRGKSLSWNKKFQTLQTGNTNELQLNDVIFYAATKTIEQDREIDWEFVNLVKSILQTRTDEKIFAKALKVFCQ